MAPQGPGVSNKEEHEAAANSTRRSAGMLLKAKTLQEKMNADVEDSHHDPTKRGISAEQLAEFFIEHCGLIMPSLEEMQTSSKPFCLPTKLTTTVINANNKLMQEKDKQNRWSPNLYAVTTLCILKVTKGISYAQQVNEEKGLPAREPQFVIVHHWGEEFAEFMQSILRHALYLEELADLKRRTTGATEWLKWRDVTYWCSPFSENQHRYRETEWTDFKEDSPVHKVLEASCCEGVVVTLNLMVSAFTRLWCIYEVLLADRSKKDILLCTQYGPLVQDQSQRSEEQAEWAAHMVAVLRDLNIRAATCAAKEDYEQIKEVIESEFYPDQGDECMVRAEEDFKRILASEAIFLFALRGWKEAVQDALLLKVDPDKADRRGIRPLTYAAGCRRTATSGSRAQWDKVVELLLTGGDSDEERKEDAEAVVDMWDDNMRKRASALRRMRESEKKPSFEKYHRESFRMAQERHLSLCNLEQAKRDEKQHVPPQTGGNLCYAPTRHHLKRAHDLVTQLHATQSVVEAKELLQQVCKEEIDSEEANIARDYKLIGHLRKALEAHGINLPHAGLFWQGGCVYGRAKAGDPPWKVADRVAGKLNIIKESLAKVCGPVDWAALQKTLDDDSGFRARLRAALAGSRAPAPSRHQDYAKNQAGGNTLMVVLSDMEPDDVMAIAQLWHLKHAELAGPPVLGMLLDLGDKDKGNIFALKLLIASLMLGVPSSLHLLPPAPPPPAANKEAPAADKQAPLRHASGALAADAVERRGEAIEEICQAIRAFRGENVDLYVLGPGHGNISAILKGLQASGAWPPARGTRWQVRMYTGNFNMKYTTPEDLDALKSIASSFPDCPLVDIGKFPLFGKKKFHPCTDSFTTFALETFASKLNIQAPLLAGSLKMFNDDFNAILIATADKLFGKPDEPHYKLTREQREYYDNHVKKLYVPEKPATIREYAKAVMEGACWSAVEDKKKSTVVGFAKEGCDSPLCDQLVFLQEWLTREPVPHPRALTEVRGHWIAEAKKLTDVKPVATETEPVPVPAVQPCMEDPYDEELLDYMRTALQDFLLGHLEVLYP